MAELESISIRGFKSIASIEELPLGPINIVIGANGSGKSNFIGVFSFLYAIREGHLQESVVRAGGADNLLTFGRKVTPSLGISISFRQGTYGIDLAPTEANELLPLAELTSASFPNHNGQSAIHSTDSAHESLAPDGKEAVISVEAPLGSSAYHVRNFLKSWRLYHFDDASSSSPMKRTADVDDNRYLRPDASNLAAYLYYLRLKQTASYSLIRRTVQLVAPFFDDFQLEPQRLNPAKIRLGWRHKGSEAFFDVSSLSDGTLRFIALATLFLQPEVDRPSVILVDEPELGLHPYAITMLASLVKQAVASNKTQVIMSTQSPLLVDQFEPEDILVADRVDGGSQFTRLDSTRLREWLDDYSLGQLWLKNEIGGRPGSESRNE